MLEALLDHVVDTDLRQSLRSPSASSATALLESACCQLGAWKAAGRAQDTKMVNGGWFNETAAATAVAHVRNQCHQDLILLAKTISLSAEKQQQHMPPYTSIAQLYLAMLQEQHGAALPPSLNGTPQSLPIPPVVHRKAIQRLFAPSFAAPLSSSGGVTPSPTAASWVASLSAVAELHRQVLASQADHASSRGGPPHRVQPQGLPQDALAEVVVQLVSRRIPVPQTLRNLSDE